MKKTWLILDMNYLAHRAFHTTGGLKWGNVQTGVTYGIFRDIISLQEQFGTHHIAFCFDHGKSIRKQIYPDYKKKRTVQKMSEEHRVAHNALENEIFLIKKMYLPYLGYENVLYQSGYEADDVIAQVVKQVRKRGDEGVIVSADKDLFQLLQKDICIFNPHQKKITTSKSFFDEWGLLPEHWQKVKAVAGCRTDQVPGAAKGIGEKTVASFYRNEMPEDHRFSQPISKWIMSEGYRLSLSLVSLPLEGCETCKLVEDELDLRKWRKLTKRLGMKSLGNKTPGFGFNFRQVPLTKR